MSADILTRLQQATGPDRDLDAEIWLATTEGATRKATEVKSSTDKWPPYVIDETRDATGRLITVPAYTASIDASLALVERKLPGKWTDILRQALWLMNKVFDWHICLKKPEQRNLLPVYILIALLTTIQETYNADQ